jgi:hypothetical protein
MLACLLVIGSVLPLPAQPTTAAPVAQPRAAIGTWQIDDVADWQRGVTNGLLISNNDGGELRLDAERVEGAFISDPFEADFTFNAAGAIWRADLPQDTGLTLELRGRDTAPPAGDISTNAGWSEWYPLIAGDARSQADDGAFATPDVAEFPVASTHLQLRATFDTRQPRASAVLNEITIAYLNTTQGPRAAAGLPRVPIQTGPETLTRPPEQVPRAVWGGPEADIAPLSIPPRGIILHQISVSDQLTDTLSLLRAQKSYQIDVLGWSDLTYHYLIDDEGTLYEGRLGGPTSLVPRLAGGDTAVHVALIGQPDSEPSAAAQDTLVSLLAWLGQAYEIAPTGEHTVVVGDNRSTRANIAPHSAVSNAADPGGPVLALLPALRERANAATVRSRWFFPEGNVSDYIQRLVFLNRADEQSTATLTLFPDNTSQPITTTVELPAAGRTDLVVNDILSGTITLPIIVESSSEVVVERTTGFTSDLSESLGVQAASRVWYFAEGATTAGFQTFLLLFNPQASDVEVGITYMRDNGSQSLQQVRLPARQQVAINVGEVLTNASFGMRIVASQPIVAERTMRFGANGSGMHIGGGVSQLSRNWYFAEGSTQAPFQMRLIMLNPNLQPSVASVTFMTPDGTFMMRRYAIPRTSQLVVDVNEAVPELGVATMIEADRPLVVERSLYLPPTDAATEPVTDTAESDIDLPGDIPARVGTVSFGAREPAYSWRFAAGRTDTAETFLLMSNPSRGQARVTVEFVLGDGSRPTQEIVMPAGSRFTLPVHDIYPDESSIAAIVRSTQPIVAERSVFPQEGLGAGGASTALGLPGE